MEIYLQAMMKEKIGWGSAAYIPTSRELQSGEDDDVVEIIDIVFYS